MTLDDLTLLLDAAQRAGDLATDLRRQGLEVEYKAGNSPVTNADLAVDSLLTAQLREARPDYGWLSEETADDVARLSRKRLFVVDPIDGTRAFLNDKPWWAVSLAIVENDRPIAGVVYAPEVGEIYAAVAGQGATLNGQAIGPSARDILEGCRLVGDPALYRRPEWPIPWPEMVVEPRNSTAYRICLVAAGVFDAAIAPLPKHDWDLAAGDLIAIEAGAYVGDHLGQVFRYNRPKPVQASLVCAAKPLAPLILERVRHIRAAN